MSGPSDAAVAAAVRRRNDAWAANPRIPGWVRLEREGLDRFFTRPEVAARCWESLQSAMRSDGADPGQYFFVDPAAGAGAFYSLLPPGRRAAVDLLPDPTLPDCEVSDFLAWAPSADAAAPVAVVGNPPFGHRSWLALAFVQHAAAFARYVGMILPPAFASDGKGSPKHRVKGARLIATEHLPDGSFTDPSTGGPVKVSAVWQIWRRGENRSAHLPRRSSKRLDVFSVDLRPQRRCGHNRLHEADWFLDRTFFRQPPAIVRRVEDMRSPTGHGLVILSEEATVTAALQSADWRLHSNPSTDGRRHISFYHIHQALAAAGCAAEAAEAGWEQTVLGEF